MAITLEELEFVHDFYKTLNMAMAIEKVLDKLDKYCVREHIEENTDEDDALNECFDKNADYIVILYKKLKNNKDKFMEINEKQKKYFEEHDKHDIQLIRKDVNSFIMISYLQLQKYFSEDVIKDLNCLHSGYSYFLE